MRIVSLLPSTTEIVAALGIADQLVAVSHACDFPAEILRLPRASRAARARRSAGAGLAGETPARAAGGEPAAPLTAAEIGDWELDITVLRAVRPDLVLLGDSAEGARAASAVREALAGDDVSVVSFDPTSLEGIFNVFATVGAMTESEDEAIGLVEMLREDLGELEETAVQRRDEGVQPPRVVVLEALRPPTASARWIPELVRLAGGWDVLGCEGEARATATTWRAVRDVDPHMIVLAPVGLDVTRTVHAWRRVRKPAFWADIDAVQRGQVFAVDSVYLTRPGPRIVDGVAMLAEIFDPEGFVETSPPYSWTPVSTTP